MTKKWTEEKVNELLQLINMLNVQSLDMPIQKDNEEFSDVTLNDMIVDTGPGPQEQLEIKDVTERLLNYVSKLPARDAKIISLRYGLDDGHFKTLEQVAQMYGVTREYIRQIEMKALKKLKWLIMVKGKIHNINDF